MPDTRTFHASWPAAVARAFHPARWGLCLIGLVLTGLVLALALALFERQPLAVGAWWQDPSTQGGRLAEHLFGHGFGRAVWYSALLAIALGVPWAPVGAWIARAECLAQRPAGEAVRTGATQLVARRVKTLGCLAPMLVLVLGMTLLPGLAAGLINLILGLGIGAVLVSLFLPFLVLLSLAAALILAGVLSFPLMTAAVAIEDGDQFEALSRGCSYLYQRPLHYAWWTGLALAISCLPLAGVFALLGAPPDLLAPEGPQVLPVLALALSLSLLWTLFSLVYLKMRRLVDGMEEDEVWDSEDEHVAPAVPPAAAPDASATQETTANTGPAESSAPPKTVPARSPVRTRLSLADTWQAGNALGLGRLAILLLASLGAGLALAIGGKLACQLTAVAGQPLTADTLRQAVLELAGQRPLALGVLLVGAVLLGAILAGGLLKTAARLAAVEMVFGRRLPMKTAWLFVRRTRGLGIGSVILTTVGVQLYLAAGLLVLLASRGECPWQEVALVGGVAVGFVGLGTLGLGALAVEGRSPAAFSIASDNVLETLASALASLGIALLRFALGCALLWVAWGITFETLRWSGGEKVRWVRWGLDGSLWPDAEPGLYQAASAIAGLWFALFFGLALTYPLSAALRWGASCYLLARQRTQDVGPETFELTPAEEAALAAPPQKRKRSQ